MPLAGFAYKVGELGFSRIASLAASAPREARLHILDAEFQPTPLEGYLKVLEAARRRDGRALLTVQVFRPEAEETIEKFCRMVEGLERWAGLALVPGVLGYYFQAEANAHRWKALMEKILTKLSGRGFPILLGGTGERLAKVNISLASRFEEAAPYTLHGFEKHFEGLNMPLYVYLPVSLGKPLDAAVAEWLGYIARRLGLPAEKLKSMLEHDGEALEKAGRFILAVSREKLKETLEASPYRVIVKATPGSYEKIFRLLGQG